MKKRNIRSLLLAMVGASLVSGGAYADGDSVFAKLNVGGSAMFGKLKDGFTGSKLKPTNSVVPFVEATVGYTIDPFSLGIVLGYAYDRGFKADGVSIVDPQNVSRKVNISRKMSGQWYVGPVVMIPIVRGDEGDWSINIEAYVGFSKPQMSGSYTIISPVAATAAGGTPATPPVTPAGGTPAPATAAGGTPATPPVTPAGGTPAPTPPAGGTPAPTPPAGGTPAAQPAATTAMTVETKAKLTNSVSYGVKIVAGWKASPNAEIGGFIGVMGTPGTKSTLSQDKRNGLPQHMQNNNFNTDYITSFVFGGSVKISF